MRGGRGGGGGGFNSLNKSLRVDLSKAFGSYEKHRGSKKQLSRFVKMADTLRDVPIYVNYIIKR